MKCSDIQLNWALHVDGSLDERDSVSVNAHLDACPLCREKHDEFREIRSGLRQMRRPDISDTLRRSIKQNVRAELRTSQTTWLPVSSDIRQWLRLQVMPYGVGVFASVLIGLTFLTMMFSGMLKPGAVQTPTSGDSSITLVKNADPLKDSVISPTDYAQTRLGFADESPSVNPQGALIALTRSLVRGGMKDDEVVVVADVFSNGLAQIAEVVEPSRDRRAVGELQKALDSDPAYAPFVGSNIENRPESVRVVLKFQSVDVSTRPRRHR